MNLRLPNLAPLSLHMPSNGDRDPPYDERDSARPTCIGGATHWPHMYWDGHVLAAAVWGAVFWPHMYCVHNISVADVLGKQKTNDQAGVPSSGVL